MERVILIIYRDKQLSENLKRFFINKGFRKENILLIGSKKMAYHVIKESISNKRKIYAIIVDITIIKQQGFSIITEITKIDNTIPIILTTRHPKNLNKKKEMLNNYPPYPYIIRRGKDQVLETIKRAVKHFTIINQNLEPHNGCNSFTVKTCEFQKIHLSTIDIIKMLFRNYIGNSSGYIMHLINQREYFESTKLIDNDSSNISKRFKIFESDISKYPSRILCYEPTKENIQEIFNSLISGGQAIFIFNIAFLTEPEKFIERKKKKNLLNQGGFIVEQIVESIEDYLIIECRKPIALERILEKRDKTIKKVLIKEVQNDKEAQDYYRLYKEFFDLSTRWIDVSFDQYSALFVLYYQIFDGKNDKIIEKAIGITRVIPNSKIKLPVEYGLIVDSFEEKERKYFRIDQKSRKKLLSAEVSHLALLDDKRIKQTLNLKSTGEIWSIKAKALTILFSTALNYCISKRIKTVYISYNRNDVRLGNLYKKIGFVPTRKEIHYEDDKESCYIVMKMDLEETIKRAIREDNLFQINLLKNSILNPTRMFIEIHEQIFNTVPAYKKMYRDIIELLKDAEKKSVVGTENNTELVVLDIPVTTGNMSRLLSKMYNKIIGIDISQYSLILGKKKALQKNNKIKYIEILANVTQKLPLQDESVDRFVCTNLLYAMSNPDNLVRELYRVLKTNGFGVVTNFNKHVLLSEEKFMKKINIYGTSGKNIRFWKKSNDLLYILSGCYEKSHFNKEEFKKILQEAGFKIINFKEVFLGNAYSFLVKK